MNSDRLRHFAAFEHLPDAALDKLLQNGSLKSCSKKDFLFKQGDPGSTSIYLLEGELLALYPDGREKRLTPGDTASQYPIGNLNPRPFDLRVHSKAAQVFIIEREVQDQIVTLASLSEAEPSAAADDALQVQETEVDPQWLFRMLQSPAFSSMPADKLDLFMAAIEQVEYKADDIVVRQGEPGDYYYLIQKGSVLVEREQGPVRFPIATLQADSAFGEEALLNEQATRNATVRMLEDGTLARLHRDDFKKLLEPAFIQTVKPGELPALLKAQSHCVVDVRLQPAFSRHHLKGSINLPLFQLRKRMAELPADQPLLLVCDSGVQSRAAAFILKEKGFDTCVLEGGLSQLKPDPAQTAGEEPDAG